MNTWNIPQDRMWGASLALTFHLFLFTAGSLGFMQKAEFGIDGSNGLEEVDLVAAPALRVSVANASPLETPAPHEAPSAAPEDIAEPIKATPAPVQPSVTLAPNAVLRTDDLNGPLGDGSSPIPGTDATTLHRAGSSGSYFKPGYYRNPPPPYPEEARKLKQEGRVVLSVTVSIDGKVAASQIKQSSGFPLLDAAALKGVQNWKFRPARVAGMAVETLVDVPVRFQLK